MARAIVRYSCNGKPAGKQPAEKARGEFRKILKTAGFHRVGGQKRGTASWENPNAPTAQIGKALKEIFEVVEGLPAGVLDHVWTYCDE